MKEIWTFNVNKYIFAFKIPQKNYIREALKLNVNKSY